MKPILWTQHALDGLKTRPFPRDLIELTAREPEWTEPDPDPQVERRFRTFPELGGRVLRVPCVETDAHIRIVTVLLDRNARRRRR